VPSESESNLRLEIGHVLFIDLVGYSKLLIEEQKQWLRQLTDVVLATAQVREATNEQLVRLPTGDGMALVFRNSAEEPAQCALATSLLVLFAATVAAFVLVSRRSIQSILPEKSIAVLPLANMSGDPNNEYFSDGLSEELIAVLAKIPALKIIGRSSSFLFKGTSDNSRTIGKKLGVTNLLEGTVRKEGDHIRIMAELINAADGRTV